MIADGLTKDKADPVDLLRSCIRAGTYQISPEETALEQQAEEREIRRARQVTKCDVEKPSKEVRFATDPWLSWKEGAG